MGYIYTLNLFELHTNSLIKTHIHYKGPFNNIILKVIGNQIRDVLCSSELLEKKIYRIFIELAQNVALYSQERYNFNSMYIGVGSVKLIEKENNYELISLNLCTTDDVLKIMTKVDRINHSDAESLREFKREQLQMPDSRFGGGNIGLIKVALTSQNQLKINTYNKDKHKTFLEIIATINK